MNLSEKPKVWVALFLLCAIITLSVIAGAVAYVDPLFHYSAPNTDEFYYRLYNERSQNDGIVKHFEYDALITGTSMTENFRTTEMDEIFGTHSIKAAFSGGTFNEVNNIIKVAAENNNDLKVVIRGLDMGMFIQDKDALREDMGMYPTYLYDDNVFNDVKYWFNRDELFGRVIPMIIDRNNGEKGIDSFDSYWRWANWYPNGVYGINSVCPSGIEGVEKKKVVHLTEDELRMVEENTTKNITAIPEKYPDITFYYFITPYSAVYWQEQIKNDSFDKQIEAERIIIEKCLEQDNIKLYSFNLITDITTDLNNYRDDHHYGSWINTLILEYMYNGDYILEKDNYEKYLEKEYEFYGTFDYMGLNEQIDYEDDNCAERIIDYRYIESELQNRLYQQFHRHVSENPRKKQREVKHENSSCWIGVYGTAKNSLIKKD